MDLLDDQHIWEMSGSFEFYRDFHSVEQAKMFAKILIENRVPYRLEKSQTLLDAAIVGHGLVPPALIKVRSSDFKKVNEILRESVLRDPNYSDSHYLQQLDDKELIAVVRNPTEWTVEDVAIARKILDDRGIPIPREHIENINKQINEELRKGKKAGNGMLLLNLASIIFGAATTCPVLLIVGIAMGWYYWREKTVDNQGGKFYAFDKFTRSYGKWMIVLGLLVLVVGGVALLMM